MRRFFSTRRFFRSGKNKISILNPCSPYSATIYSCLYRLTVLGMFCLLVKLLLEKYAGLQDVEPPPVAAARIFCIISTLGYRQQGSAVHIKRTWAKHCDKFLVVSDDSHEELEPAVFVNLPDKWHRLRAHLKYVYNYHFDEGDWFLLSTGHNFVVVENLRHMLQSHNSDELIYFGCKLKSPEGQAYMYDRSSMVFSSATIQNFVLKALTNETICSSQAKGKAATEELGRCLTNINVVAGDSRDHQGNHRFLPFEVKNHMGNPLNESLHKSFLDRSYYQVDNLILPVSVRFISSYVEYMPFAYNLYYLIYKVQHFGVPQVRTWQEKPEVDTNNENLHKN